MLTTEILKTYYFFIIFSVKQTLIKCSNYITLKIPINRALQVHIIESYLRFRRMYAGAEQSYALDTNMEQNILIFVSQLDPPY